MDLDIRIGRVGGLHRDLLIEMYDRFEPLGAAFGLPPRGEELRHKWIDAALSHQMNLAAFTSTGTVVGHCFLAADRPASAELAIFVHQEFCERGVGTALARAMLEWASMEGVRRIWTLTGSENTAALRLQEKVGFHIANTVFYGVELEIHLPAAYIGSEMTLTGCAA